MFSKQQTNEAAKSHALKQLGQEQFDKNKDAAKAISEDFKDGVSFIINTLKKQLADSYKINETIDYHAFGFDVVESLKKIS